MICSIIMLCNQAADAATNKRSDTIDITHISIHLDITDFANQTIGGYTTIYFSARMPNQQQLVLDLLKMNIDSVKSANQPIPYTYDSNYLKINFLTTLISGAADSVTIYYHGHPQADPTGWGGFSFSGGYAYNLGVGFSTDPHAFGRCWFPCFDNFVERSTYNFAIKTDSTRKAFCNGLLTNSPNDGQGHTTWYWNMAQTIPSYLASVAVSNYTTVYQTYNGVNGPIPIQLGALPGDTTNLKNSFIHLPNALQTFESRYLPYQFDRVGYVLVPFNSGAMEHATNIAYPRLAANGTTSLENLYAHELSHHWWGDLVTCDKEEEMWLNEGWASYSEKLFYEQVYGYGRYQSEVRTNHTYVLQYAHVDDGLYYPVSGVPHSQTYGTTVYKKGSDMIHTLRSYMGDSLFFKSINTFLNRNKWKSINSIQLRDSLSLYSGINLTDYFNDWILQPNFLNFDIGNWYAYPNNGNYTVMIAVEARSFPKYHAFQNVPLEIAFFDATWHKVVKKISLQNGCTGGFGGYTVNLNFMPVYVALDFDEKLSDAVSDDWKVIKQIGSNSFQNGKMTVAVQSVIDSALIRVEHHWCRPEGFKNTSSSLHLADRYWRVDGIDLNKMTANATIQFDGTTSSGFMDEAFITNSEDSILLFYHDLESPCPDWQLYNSYTVNKQGSATNKKGSITINNLQPGEYAMAIRDYHWVDTASQPFQYYMCCISEGIDKLTKSEAILKLIPNPANTLVDVILTEASRSKAELKVFNVLGQCVFRKEWQVGQDKLSINVQDWLPGMYQVEYGSAIGLSHVALQIMR